MIITIRKALAEDLPWVNQQYDVVGFQRSSLQGELILIAEVEGEKAGVGRLLYLSETEAELGGMYVAEQFRKLGIARKIVEELKSHAAVKTVYCLPFEHLESFYISCGFTALSSCTQIPESIQTKLDWCSNTYQQDTLLLIQQL